MDSSTSRMSHHRLGHYSRELWHHRLGCPSDFVINYLSHVSNSKNSIPCDTCFNAKQTREWGDENFLTILDIFRLCGYLYYMKKVMSAQSCHNFVS